MYCKYLSKKQYYLYKNESVPFDNYSVNDNNFNPEPETQDTKSLIRN